MSHIQNIHHKICSKEVASERISEWKKNGKKVVFTNGCFDILHLGHVTYLAKSAEFGDRLVIAINSDASVKRLGKGDDRPINSESSRAVLLAALAFVDIVLVFDQDTPLELIQYLKPDVLVKGGDYDSTELNADSPKYIVGSEEVRKMGGEVKTVDLVEGFSTTSILKKITS